MSGRVGRLDCDELTVKKNDNYDVTLDVTDEDGDGEVTVYFDTYQAGENNDAAFYTADDSDDTVEIAEENGEQVIEDNTGDSRLLPGSFNLELFVDEDENGDREKVDAAFLRLTEGSIDSVSPGAAPSDANRETVDDIVENAKESDEIAEGDRVLFSFEASGVFGAIDAGEFDDHFDLILEETDDPYDADPLEEGDDYRIVEDAENDRFFVVLNEDVELEAGEDYELRLEPQTDGSATTTVAERELTTTSSPTTTGRTVPALGLRMDASIGREPLVRSDRATVDSSFLTGVRAPRHAGSVRDWTTAFVVSSHT